MVIDNNLLLEFLEKMYLIRQFESKLYNLSERGLVFGSVHLCMGEEATAVGTCMNLKKEDYLIATHRGHGQEIAKGSDIKKMLAEMIGKETGLCKGRVGSMHITDRSVNNLGAQGIIGASFPISVGVGLAIKLQNLDRILISFFGDGATNQGNFYESLNMVDLWSLPVLFACVNNLYGMGTHYEKTCNINICEKSKIFNIRSESVDGNNVEEVFLKTRELVNYIREKQRPALIEMKTYRILGHSAFDKHPYRSKEEIEEWKNKDPIKKLEDKLLTKKINSEPIESIKKKIDSMIAEAEKFALESKYPTFNDSLVEE
ncbi:MAG: thiamine pyrophosphate-dependent dehydrogenase E1 component subunit alpha [Nitrososphaeraceae archaeon]